MQKKNTSTIYNYNAIDAVIESDRRKAKLIKIYFILGIIGISLLYILVSIILLSIAYSIVASGMGDNFHIPYF